MRKQHQEVDALWDDNRPEKLALVTVPLCFTKRAVLNNESFGETPGRSGLVPPLLVNELASLIHGFGRELVEPLAGAALRHNPRQNQPEGSPGFIPPKNRNPVQRPGRSGEDLFSIKLIALRRPSR